MTPSGLKTGTDRIAWALRGRDFDWVMNVQGDEPLIEPSVLQRLIRRARSLGGSAIITAASLIRGREEYRDPNKVKVVFDRKGRALYFSRAPIPDVSRHGSAWRGRIYGHVGIYLFHREAFLRFTRSPQSPLEKAEKLEQLRALELDIPVYVEPVDYRAINVDAPPDIAKAERCLRKRK